MRQGQKVDFGVFIGQASFREPKELNPGDRFIQLDKHYDGPVALPPASGLSLALILVATAGGPTMFARIGVMRALNRHVERAFNPNGKDHHWGRRKLARDR